MKRIYLDNAATTQVDDKVLQEMLPYFSEKFGNPNSLHSFGQETSETLSIAREKVAKLINADPGEIIFTSGGSESDNFAIKKIMIENKAKGNHFITSVIEHPAVLRTAEYLEKIGFNVTYVKVNEKGLIDPHDVKKAITDKTVLVSIMHANNEIGTVQPIEEIAKICKEKKVWFHTDAVQTVGKVPIDVKSTNIDMLSASGHKIHGPKGIGFLYVRKGIPLQPFIHGGGQENGKRSGTENIPGCIGMGKACEIARENLAKDTLYILTLREKLINGLQKIPKSYLNGDREKRLPNNVHFRFDYIEGEALLMHLDMEGIAISTGSACSSKSLRPSHVLLSLGLKPVQAHGSARFTLSKYTTEEDIDYVLAKLPPIVSKLRSMSPLNDSNVDDFPDEDVDHDHGEEEHA